MPNCTAPFPLFSPLKRRQITLSFEGGDVTSDAGLLLLQRIDGQLHSAGSSPTLRRFENRENRAAAVAIARALVEQFIVSVTATPSELILDFDATDDPVRIDIYGRRCRPHLFWAL